MLAKIILKKRRMRILSARIFFQVFWRENWSSGYHGENQGQKVNIKVLNANRKIHLIHDS